MDWLVRKTVLDAGLDLGTGWLRLGVRGKEQTLEEPNLVAIDKVTTEIVAVGAQALEMLGRAPERIRVVRPWRNGVVSDYDAAEAYLRYQLFTRLKLSSKPALLLGLPLDASEVEAKAATELMREAGAGSVCLLPSLVLGAVGAGLPVLEAQGHLVLDLGAGTAEAAVLSLGGVVSQRCLRRGGLELDRALADYLRLKRFLLVGERSLEELKRSVASADLEKLSQRANVRGRDLVTGLPREISVSSEELMPVLAPMLLTITDLVLQTMEQTPPELLAYVLEQGLTMCGGVASLPGLDAYLSKAAGINCAVPAEPQRCGLLGCQRLLKDRYLLDVLLAAQGERVPAALA